MDIGTALSHAASGAGVLSQAVDAAGKLRDMVKGDKGPDAEVLGHVLDLYNQLIDARSHQISLQDALRTLQAKDAEREERERDFARYEMTTTAGADVVYRLKTGRENGEPPHHICPACKLQAKKSLLQPRGTQLHCFECGGKFQNEPAASGIAASNDADIDFTGFR